MKKVKRKVKPRSSRKVSKVKFLKDPMFIGAYIVTFVGIVAILLWAVSAYAHDIYTDWKMPDNRGVNGQRYYSCCNNQDCMPHPEAKFDQGHWYVQHNNGWLLIPDSKIETKYRDAWITPDGLAHACISHSGVVYCFTPPGGAV